MTPRRWVAAGLGALLVIVAVVAALFIRQAPAEPPGDRPELLLLTSLPIVFPEGFTLDAPKSPVLAALEGRYRVVPINATGGKALAGHELLLMAQPQAQTAENLVALDSWVRAGGHVLLLADPVLRWPSEKALGDVTRPPMAFPDTGLLGHWGLRLNAPDSLEPAKVAVDGKPVYALAPGKLVATGPGCAVGSQGLVARCAVGEGRATVIADSDFANVDDGDLAQSGNLAFLMAELARLQ